MSVAGSPLHVSERAAQRHMCAHRGRRPGCQHLPVAAQHDHQGRARRTSRGDRRRHGIVGAGEIGVVGVHQRALARQRLARCAGCAGVRNSHGARRGAPRRYHPLCPVLSTVEQVIADLPVVMGISRRRARAELSGPRAGPPCEASKTTRPNCVTATLCRVADIAARLTPMWGGRHHSRPTG